MIMDLPTIPSKAVLRGPDKTAAISVLVPRIFGALEEYGVLVRRVRNRPWELHAQRSHFVLWLCPNCFGFYFRVMHFGHLRMTGGIRVENDGQYFDGRLKVHRWERNTGDWQERLLLSFNKDSDALLTMPASDIRAWTDELYRSRGPNVRDIRIGIKQPLLTAKVIKLADWQSRTAPDR